MTIANPVAVCSANERIFMPSFRMFDFATVDHLIYEDNSVSIRWDFSDNWFKFDAPTGSYKHHTRLLRQSGGTTHIYNRQADVAVPTNDIYFSNDGAVPGNTYNSAESSTSHTYFTFRDTSGSQQTYFMFVGSFRGGLAASEVVEGFVIKTSAGTSGVNFLPFE